MEYTRTVSIPQLKELAERIALTLKCGDSVFLKGELGAGKTTFARFLIETLCGKDLAIPSPTFPIMIPYCTHQNEPLWHVDLYRITDTSDLHELGICDLLASSISIIEWPDLLAHTPSITVALSFTPDILLRSITLSPSPSSLF